MLSISGRFVSIIENTKIISPLEKWLEKTGKKAWHEHDGFLSHPVAVKHHEEYFAGKEKIAEVEKPQEIKEKKPEPVYTKEDFLNWYKDHPPFSHDEFREYFDLLPIGSSFLTSDLKWTKIDDEQWQEEYGKVRAGYDLSSIIADAPDNYKKDLLASVKIAKEEEIAKPPAKTDQDITADILKDPDVVDIDQWQKEYEIVDKQQRGSTEGFKVLHKPSGIQYYVKFPGLEQVGIEDLANRLYRLAGVPVAFSSVLSTEKGFGIGSKWLPNAQKVPADSDEAIKDFVRAKPEILNNFVVDAWLANWDAVGLDYDNLVYSNGKVYRIDQGGSMMLQAQGEVKPFGDKVPELESMRDPEKAPQASRFFKYVEEKHLKAGASKLAAITDEQIKNVVSGLIGHEEIEKERIANTLIKRRDYIVNKILTQKEREKKPCSPGLHRHKEYEVCHPIDRRHRGQAGFGTTFAGIDRILSRVKDKEIRDLWQRAKHIPDDELIANAGSIRNLGEIFGFSEVDMEYVSGTIGQWQGGGIPPMVKMRGAINYLKGQSEEKYAQEQAYFLYEREASTPRAFDSNYKSGIRNAKYYIPFIAATQAILRKKHPSGFVELFRGIGEEAGRKLRSQYNMMADEDILAVPHSGLSAFSTKKHEAKVFARPNGITLKKQASINDVWLRPSSFTGVYEGEAEYLVDGDVVQLFRKDELIV